MMRHPTEFTAAELAEALGQYGDMRVAAIVLDAEPNQLERPVTQLRLEIWTEPDGRRVVAVVGYTPDDAETV